MPGLIDAELLGQIRTDTLELRRTLGHLDYKVQQIGQVFADAGLAPMVASLKPLLVLLALQGFVNIVLLALIAFR